MEIDPAAAWNGLEEPWRVCLSLAWEAYGAGTIPLGAALVDATGAVVAEGRNRVYEPDAPPRQLANSLLGHAEVNALLALDPEQRHAGADPYGGGDGALTGSNAHTERVPLRIEGPREDAFGLLASAPLPAFFLRRNPNGHVVRAFAERAPATLTVAERLLEAGAPELAARGVALQEALEAIWMYLARAEPL
jgi:hypothetical protein